MTEPKQPQPVSAGDTPCARAAGNRPFPRLFSALLAGALLLAACGTPAASTSTTAPAAPTDVPTTATMTDAATTEATTAAIEAPAATTEVTTEATTEAPTGAATTDATTPATTGTATAEDATPTIVIAANAFLETLSDTERESVLFDWSDTAQKQRWSNLPEGLFERDGLRWSDMSEASQTAWLALMEALLSEEGYARVLAAWYADDQLAGGGGPGGGQLLYGRGYYWVALIGTPSETEPWQFQWGGHHITINATIAGADVALVPSFVGCQPCTYTDESGATVRPLGDIADEAFALVTSLDATQQQAAVLGSESIDLVLGPGEEGRTIESEGLPASAMTEAQRAAFLQLISHYTGLVNEEDAAARLAAVESTLDETYFAWYGPTDAVGTGYFRVTGPTIVIEFSPQSMGGDVTDHVHGIYRDPTNDYGATIAQ